MNRGNTCLHLILILYNKPATLDNKHYKKINIVVCSIFGVAYYKNPKWNRMLRNKKRSPAFLKNHVGAVFLSEKSLIHYTMLFLY